MATFTFGSETADMIFALTFMIWIASEYIGAIIIPRMRRKGSVVKRRNLVSNVLIIIDWIILLYVISVFHKNDLAKLPAWVFSIGIIMMLLGIVIRQWAIAVLGRFFSGVIGVQIGHKVVNNGPYRLVRHPSYTGALILQIGIGLAAQSWGAVLVIIICFGIFYGHRMIVEERMLVKELGEDYSNYMQRTKRLVPYII